jgi:hypothetical protein
MSPRRCRYCQQPFSPSRFHPRQAVCRDRSCQQRRRREDRRRRLASDPEYRQVCRDSAQKWRAAHRGYFQQYRQTHPAAVLRNRTQQQVRDQTRRLRDLANHNLAFTQVLIVPGESGTLPDRPLLANNNILASASVPVDNRSRP